MAPEYEKKLDTSRLKKFAQFARHALHEQVGTQLDAVLQASSMERREYPEAIAKIEGLLRPVQGSNEKAQRELLIERVAYTWFNRFCALRYMDVNRYTRIGIVSPTEGQFQPEILAEAKMGHMDDELVPEQAGALVTELLSGKAKSEDPQSEAYRTLFVAACNYYHKLFPFMFEPIVDYTELLLPSDLLSGNSVLAHTREALLPANCSPEYTEQSVEVIGWLYQFYISEKKDDVFAALKKGKKIMPENIPAATQLFTPHWIVRYLVENSLGRLWMLNNPDSTLIDKMEYYIQPEAPETDFLRISSPEEIKICDPACGSGHMLTYAFDLLYAIYEEQGYQATDIPQLILINNLYGVEIDHRAGALAAFVLTMKAREKYRRFLTSGKIVQPNICVLENIQFDADELSGYMDRVGRDLFSKTLEDTLNQWGEADNFGSLIRPLVTDVSEMLELLRERQMDEDMFLAGVHQNVLKALRQADYLSPKYHVVVANPPYMGSKGMNARLRDFAQSKFDTSKSDLFAMFMARSIALTISRGLTAMLTMQSWMFLPSLRKFRSELYESTAFCSMAHLGPHAFDTIGGEVVATTAFVFAKDLPAQRGTFLRLVEGKSESAKQAMFKSNKKGGDLNFVVSTEKFEKLPLSPVGYWADQWIMDLFERNEESLFDITISDGQTKTGDNDRFLRFLWEPQAKDVGTNGKWWLHPKGGSFRKWYGNIEWVINWSEEARTHYRNDNVARILPEYLWFKNGVSWTNIAGDNFSFRYLEPGHIFNLKAPTIYFENDDDTMLYLAYLNSNPACSILQIINPTLSLNVNEVRSVPPIKLRSEKIIHNVGKLVNMSKEDWNSMETAWGFQATPLLNANFEQRQLRERYRAVRRQWESDLDTVSTMEDENGNAFCDILKLTDAERVGVPITDLTFYFNPAYRYDSDKRESELEALLLADTMREFISYAVGCMLGRYSLDKPGLILANQGETTEDYRQQIPEPTFAPDEDNVIPLLDGDWFEDDITERFKAFLKVTFGTEHFDENLTFLENSLYPDNLAGKKRKTIRDYFLKEFYNHHIKLYKKRPIYWLFSSPKGTFNALVYMHRYRSDTVSVVLNEYLREFQIKLRGRLEQLQNIADIGDASKAEKARALKDVSTLNKQLKELEDYERDILFLLAQQQIEIDLDDGVKHNYPLFGKALKKVPGLS